MNRKRFLLLSCAVICCLVMNAQSGSIVAMEYWLDGQIANKQPLTTTTAEISIADLSPGFHHISVRSQDDKGLWSSVLTKYFIIPRATTAATITHYCYWFDDDTDNVVTCEYTGSVDLIEINLSGLSYYTEHKFYLATCDSKGAYSTVLEEVFIIEPIATGEAMPQDKVQSSKFKVQSEEWYSIDGQKLNGRPTERGVYIRNGKKVVVN